MSNLESRRRISLALKGKPRPTKGKTYEEIYGQEIAEKLRELRKQKAYERGFNLQRFKFQKGNKFGRLNKGIASKLKGKTYEKILGIRRAKKLKQFRAKTFLQARINQGYWKINKIEKELLQQFPELEYVGNGKYIIQFTDGRQKNPDFLIKNQSNKVIEVFGDYWHKDDDPEELIEKYNKIGMQAFVIWEKEIKNSSFNKLRRFIYA